MRVKTKAIVLTTLKFQEKSLIVRCFTESHGMKSYFVQSAFSGKKSNQKIAYFQPLSILEIEAVHKNKGTLERFTEIKTAIPYQNIPLDVFKSSMVLFLAEILQSTIQEEEKNEALFSFLETSLLWLDTQEFTVNFHLIFLMDLSKYLGFYPDISTIDLTFFDVNEGVFNDSFSVHSINETQTNLLKKLLQLKFDSAQKAFHVSQRQQLLKIIMDYFAQHLVGFREPKSLEILKEIFA